MNQPPGGGYPPGGGGYPPGGGGYPPGGGGYPPAGGQPPAPGGGYPQPPAPGGYGQPPAPAPGGYGQPPAPAPGGYGQPPAPAPGGYGQPPPPAPGGYGQAPAPGGGYGQPPGPSGGYGPPPVAPGYGPPPAAAGYGPPPGPAYGAPPGQGGYGPPLAAPGYGGQMGGGGGRADFRGDGGTLLVTYLMFVVGPIIGIVIACVILQLVGGSLDGLANAGGIIAVPFMLLSMLIYFAGIIGVQVFFTQKIAEFYATNIKIDGQDCRYTGQVKDLAGKLALNYVLLMVTFGIYMPWFIVNMKKFVYANTEVGGRAGRLTFDGDPATLLGKYIVGMLLTYCTLGIYTPWFANELMAFRWENTKLDGTPFTFKKDPGGFFGTFLLNMLLSYCTLGIYTPWAMCAFMKWEADHVG